MITMITIESPPVLLIKEPWDLSGVSRSVPWFCVYRRYKYTVEMLHTHGRQTTRMECEDPFSNLELHEESAYS